MNGHRLPGLLIVPLLLAAGGIQAAIDLRNATVERLDNGLTVILLEDRRFPVASVQMLYRVGARDEVTGKTGLAHFLEHMAFRDSRNFPDSGLVSRIYAVGGEWRGYTWIDQTTYYATVPKDELDLLLRIEADRMQKLRISRSDMEAERGVVLTEMHMYENSPASMLIDAVNYTSFLAHPYRNNTIGWESDIRKLQHEDVVEFYERHYHPANAVIAVVGDFDRATVQKRIRRLFGRMRSRSPTPLPHTIEPLQNGERRISLHGPTGPRQFVIAYRAPAVTHPDYAAFLVLQELLGAGSGVNFAQNDWGTAVDEASLLYGAAEEVTTWYPPSAQDYVFTIGGFAADEVALADVEANIEARIARARDETASSGELARAIEDVLDAFAFDVETTEDAAHQLAFFDGLLALDVLFELPRRVAAVTAGDLRRVANTWLQPERRTIAWHVAAARPLGDGAPVATAIADLPAPRPPERPGNDPVPAATMARLSGGIPVIVQASDMSSTVHVQLVLSGDRALQFAVRPLELADTVRAAASAYAGTAAAADPVPSTDPETRLEQSFANVMRAGRAAEAEQGALQLIVVAGDIDVDATITLLEASFGALAATAEKAERQPVPKPDDVVVNLGRPVAQAQLGYIVPAPAPAERAADAYRMLLYILSHGYEGRLARKAISEAGLVYYVDSEFRSDGANAWVTLSTGVDLDKIDAFGALLRAELERLQTEPPDIAELREARNHLVGRQRSAAQSNAELAVKLATEWLWYGETLSVDALQRRLDAVTRDDLLEIIPAFIDGVTILVTE